MRGEIYEKNISAEINLLMKSADYRRLKNLLAKKKKND